MTLIAVVSILARRFIFCPDNFNTVWTVSKLPGWFQWCPDSCNLSGWGQYCPISFNTAPMILTLPGQHPDSFETGERCQYCPDGVNTVWPVLIYCPDNSNTVRMISTLSGQLKYAFVCHIIFSFTRGMILHSHMSREMKAHFSCVAREDYSLWYVARKDYAFLYVVRKPRASSGKLLHSKSHSPESFRFLGLWFSFHWASSLQCKAFSRHWKEVLQLFQVFAQSIDAIYVTRCWLKVYLIFVIFFTQLQFEVWKFYT